MTTRTDPTINAVLSDLAARGFHLMSVRPWIRDCGSPEWENRGIEAKYVRLVNGTVRCVETVRWLYIRHGQPVDRVYERDVCPVFGVAVYTSSTVYPAFTGDTLGAVV